MGSSSDQPTPVWEQRELALREHAKNHFGLGGAPGSGFIQHLYRLCDVSDFMNLYKLRAAFPQEIDAYIEVRDNS